MALDDESRSQSSISDSTGIQVGTGTFNQTNNYYNSPSTDLSPEEARRAAEARLWVLVNQSSVVLTDSIGRVLGTAFFIAPGLAITAAHVVPAADRVVYVRGTDGVIRQLAVVQRFPAAVAPGITHYPLPDLAVLEAAPNQFRGQPAVFLQEAAGSGSATALGHRVDPQTGQAAQYALAFDYSGTEQVNGVQLLETGDLPVPSGMSGSPVLDADIGAVVGFVTTSPRDARRAGVVSIVELERLANAIWARSALYHRDNATWRTAKSGDAAGIDPAAGVRLLTSAVLAEAKKRDNLLPEVTNAERLHQTIWLRRRQPKEQRGTPELAFRQRWRTDRQRSGLTVICGGPGFGKSWLLAHQAAAVAERALESMSGGGAPEECVVPVRLSCAALAGPDIAAEGIGVLAAALAAETVPESIADAAGSKGVRAVVERAIEDGRLQVCADGLDEMATTLRSSFLQNLVALLGKGNAVLIASRPSALAILDNVGTHNREDFDLVGFSTKETVLFVREWLRDRQAAADALLAALSQNDLARLAEVPLLLSFFCHLANQVGNQGYRHRLLPVLYRDVALHLLSGLGRGGRTPTDTGATPDPVLRLQLLADALGGLQDIWRGGSEEIVKTDLRQALSTHPSCTAVASTAQIRAREAFSQSSANAPTGPDAVMWEYLYDGILVDSRDAAFRPTVQFLHPVLREIMLADYVDRLPRTEQLACVDRHRWFDTAWSRVITSAAALGGDPAHLVSHIADVPSDPWLVQHSHAAQIIAEAAEYSDDHSAQLVLNGLVRATEAESAFERGQALAGLSNLLCSTSPSLRDWGRKHLADFPIATIGEQTVLNGTITAEVLCTVVETGDPDTVESAQAWLRAGTCPPHVRNRLIAGLVSLDVQEHTTQVLELLESERATGGDLTAFLSALHAHSTTALAAAIRLLRRRKFTTEARVQVARALMDCGPEGVDAVLTVANDVTMGLGLNCRLHAELLRAAVPDVATSAIRLLTNPHSQVHDRVHLILALVEDGVTEVAADAALLLSTDIVPWQMRRSLARALVRQGAAGVNLVVTQLFHPAISLDLKLRHICALVEVGDERGISEAVRLHSDRGVGEYERFVFAEVLLQNAPSQVDEASVLELASRQALRLNTRIAIAAKLVQNGFPAAGPVLLDFIRHNADEIVSWSEVALELAESGSVGVKFLKTLAKSDDLDWYFRCEAVLCIGWTTDGRIADLRDVADAMPQIWRGRLVLGLASRGLAPDLDAFIALATQRGGGYRIVYEFLQRTTAEETTVNLLLHIARKLQKNPLPDIPRREEKKLISMELLLEIGLEPKSEEEARHQLGWFSEKLESSVGLNLSRLFLNEQVEEFGEYIESDNETAAQSFLVEMLPEYPTIIDETYNDLKAQISAKTLVPPPFQPPKSISPLRSIASTSLVLDEWTGLAKRGQWRHWSAFALRNVNILATQLSLEILQISIRTSQNWGLHEAMHFAVTQLSASSTFPAEFANLPALVDLLNGAIAHRDASLTLTGGAFAAFRFPSEETGWLFAAAGCVEIGQESLAIRLLRNASDQRPANEREFGVSTLRQLGTALGWSPKQLEPLVGAYQEGTAGRPIHEYLSDVECNPDDARFHFNLGVAFQRHDETEKAVEAFENTVHLDPDNPMGRRALAGALADCGRLDDALRQALLALKLDTSSPMSHAVHGIILGRLERDEEALSAYSEARRLSPSNPHHIHNEGVSLARMGRHAEAAVRYREALSLQPDDQRTARALAAALQKAGRFTEALEAINRAVELVPNDYDTHGTRALILNCLGDYQGAVRALVEARSHAPKNATILNNLAEALVLVGRDHEAVPLLRKLLALDRINTEPKVLLSLTLYDHNTTEAQELANAVWASVEDPNLTTFRFQELRAIAGTLVGHLDQAVAILAEAASFRAPDDSYQQPLYRRLEAIAGADHVAAMAAAGWDSGHDG